MREQQHIETALEKQKLEDKKAFEAAVAKALEHHKSEIEIEQEKKVKWCNTHVESLAQTGCRRARGSAQKSNWGVVSDGRLQIG